MMLIKKQICFILSFFCCNILFAQQGTYQFAHLDFTQGLSHNQVNCIYKDAQGFMWFGTMSGLNRYDGYTFKIFRHNLKDSTSPADDYISRIGEGPSQKLWILTRMGLNIYDPSTEKFLQNTTSYFDSLGLPVNVLNNIIKAKNSYWFIYQDSGLYRYDQDKKAVLIGHHNNDSSSIDANAVADIKEDSKNYIWILHRNGIIEKMDPKRNRVVFRNTVLQKQNANPDFFYSLYIDKDDELWIYATGMFPGVYYYRTSDNSMSHFSKESGVIRLNNNIVSSIAQDNNGLIWIATDHGGVNIIDKKKLFAKIVVNNPDDDKSLAQNSIITIYKDDLGIMWLGTFKRGVNYYHESIMKFMLYRHQPSKANSLEYDDVNRFVEDAAGNIWIGTNGGGLIYFNRAENSFKQFTHDAGNINSLSNDVIVSLCIDHNNKLWIGTYFGGLDCYDGKTFTHYRHNDAVPTSISDDRIWEIYEDEDNNLWIGTFEQGLDRFDREKNIFYHYKPGAENSLHAGYISAITEDTQKNLWVATAYGIDMLEKSTGRFIHYTTADNRLSNNNVISLLNDSRGNIWAGTRDGLNIFNKENKTFKSFHTEDGLPDNMILNILEDNDHNIWISTPNGISKMTFRGNDKAGYAITCKNYDELDGLQGREFNENAALKTRNGELIFGGANGFNIFNPASIRANKNIPPVIFTSLQVFNRNVNPGDKIDGHIILPEAISKTGSITLNYDENVFSLEFAALNFTNTQKNKYAYKLEEFNKDWLITDGKSRKITYTNLDPGEYIFRVKASNDDGAWNEEGIALKIIVLPPFWKTPLAYIIYVLLIAAILYFARRMVIQRTHMRFALEQERKEGQRMHELDMMKIRFFTNVSHDFRTPLSLILTPLDKIIKNTSEATQKNQFQMIHRNARRLLNLVNQLLDFRKMEVQELKLNATEGDIAKFIKDIAYSFTDLAEKKNIEFSYESAIDHLRTKFDHDKIERILFNLLSNAFKFTLANGKVSVELNATGNTGETLLEIKITDTGIGIPKEKQEKIFERFFQNDVPGTMVNQGSGIGLSITKEFVKLHNGTVAVESEENKGTCVTVLLPVIITDTAITEIFTLTDDDTDTDMTGENISIQETGKSKKQTVLIVEDNEDFSFYLKDNLRQYFNIAEAADGKEGWQKTLSLHPDIVVSDIHMPVMNGIELCKKIKQDARTKQIPVVLLTALIDEEHQLKGLETGATDYITKPFNFEIMLSRIRNILVQQQSLKQTFTKHVEAKPSEIEVDSPDKKFVQDALAITEQHLANADFNVEELSRELCMSRVTVYKRIFALTGKTPIEFIREVRLQRAAQLLEKSQMTVAEVAYEVGFNNPKYFSKYFRAQYGVLPSAFQLKVKTEALNKQQ